MKKMLLMLLMGGVYGIAMGQSFDTLSINNIVGGVNANGMLFREWDANQGRLANQPAFEVPKGSGITPIYVSNIWIGAQRGTDTLVAAQAYGQAGLDFVPGALNTQTGAILESRIQHYNRVFKVSKKEIDDFKNSGNHSNPPVSIAQWPGNGDESFDEELSLAPFVNVGGDPDVYEPELGDYPDIYGDEAIFWVFNDAWLHTETGSPSMGLEVRAMAFEYDQPNDPLLDNILFVQYEIINRSSDDLESMYLGSWTDFDLGGFSDDYVGCNPNQDAYYVYNSSNDDAGGYGVNPPACGVVFLETPKDANNEPLGLSKFMYYDNDASVTGNPVVKEHYYNYLTGKWKNGSGMTYGGNGFGGTDPASFMFPGTLDPQGRPEWSEITAGHLGGDRRALGSSGPFDLDAGSSTTFLVAYVYARTEQGNNIANLLALRQRFFELNVRYAEGGLGGLATGLGSQVKQAQPLSIYPNPAQTEINFDLGVDSEWHISVYNVTGQQVISHKVPQHNTTSALDVANLPAGMYIMKAMNGQTVKSGRFIKK